MIIARYALCPEKLIIKDRELKRGNLREKRKEERKRKL